MGSCLCTTDKEENVWLATSHFGSIFQRDEKSMNLAPLRCLSWNLVEQGYFQEQIYYLNSTCDKNVSGENWRSPRGSHNRSFEWSSQTPGLKSELETREVNRKNGASKCWRWPLGWVNGSSPFLLLHPPFLNWGENLPLGQSQIWGVNLGLGFQVFQCLKLLAISAPIDLKRSRCQSLSIKSTFFLNVKWILFVEENCWKIILLKLISTFFSCHFQRTCRGPFILA